jgi:hypothetical protein
MSKGQVQHQSSIADLTRLQGNHFSTTTDHPFTIDWIESSRSSKTDGRSRWAGFEAGQSGMQALDKSAAVQAQMAKELSIHLLLLRF